MLWAPLVVGDRVDHRLVEVRALTELLDGVDLGLLYQCLVLQHPVDEAAHEGLRLTGGELLSTEQVVETLDHFMESDQLGALLLSGAGLGDAV